MEDEKLEDLILRIDGIPCTMSCYLTVPELQAALDMKEYILQILKGEK